jgi:hypothetical protein
VILDIVPWAAGRLTAETSLFEKLTTDIGLGQADVVMAFIKDAEVPRGSDRHRVLPGPGRHHGRRG